MEIRSILSIKDNDIQDLLRCSEYHWFHHTQSWLDYSLNMRESGSKDLSFGIIQDTKLVAFCPLVKEYIFNRKSENEFSMAGLPTVYPVFINGLSKSNKDKIEKLIFEHVFNLAKSEDISYINYYVSPLSDVVLNNKILVNPLTRFGFHDTTVSTNILKLGMDENDLFKKFRKGTKSEIKTAIRNNITVKIYSDQNIDSDIFDIYRELHFRASGRQTRPDKTWELMLEWIQSGYSILAIVSKGDERIAAQLVNVFCNKAYYHSGATDPKFDREKGVGHIGQWEIIKYLNKTGTKYYDLGLNMYPNISQEVADKKLLGISRFKSGFGGDIYPFFRGEWFRNKDIMMKVYQNRVHDFFRE